MFSQFVQMKIIKSLLFLTFLKVKGSINKRTEGLNFSNTLTQQMMLKSQNSLRKDAIDTKKLQFVNFIEFVYYHWFVFTPILGSFLHWFGFTEVQIYSRPVFHSPISSVCIKLSMAHIIENYASFAQDCGWKFLLFTLEVGYEGFSISALDCVFLFLAILALIFLWPLCTDIAQLRSLCSTQPFLPKEVGRGCVNLAKVGKLQLFRTGCRDTASIRKLTQNDKEKTTQSTCTEVRLLAKLMYIYCSK